ncbi:FAD-binding domain-containing protein [Russula dissimulans]|nr:FAD-binding domain-containing protein [Russula dissimulans]
MLRAAVCRWCTLIFSFILTTTVNGRGNPVDIHPRSSHAEVYRTRCKQIEMSLSSASQVFYPDSGEFLVDIAHWSNSSSQVSVCSVEPGTPNDVGVIVALTRTPFAIKGGGHTLNPGFSSTSGVHISLARFNDIVIHNSSGTVEVGAGLTWLDVYANLVPKGINVVGGRDGGVGVGGYVVGGGYSWKTNQYGLSVDTVVEYELVFPNGQVTVVTENDTELWFALKGIVTKITFKFHEQTDIWVATLVFAEDHINEAHVAFAKFLTQEHDHKGAQLAQHSYINGTLTFILTLFYDGPSPPEGLYDELLHLSTSSVSLFNGSFLDFTSTGVAFLPLHRKGYFGDVPVLRLTLPILEAFANETKFWGDRLITLDEGLVLIFTCEPYEPGFLNHGGPSAYPPDRSAAYPALPQNLYFGWSNESANEYMLNGIRSSTDSLIASGIKDGQDVENAVRYGNYALFGTPLEVLYGENLPLLREIRKKYDPEDVMGLTDGWKI